MTNITNTTKYANLTVGSCVIYDPNGNMYVKWIFDIMGECVHSSLEQASFYVGLASILFWTFALMPQIIQNFKQGGTDGLSVFLLIQWGIGDISNLIGSILAQQLFTQILLASYFVAMDAIIFIQFIYYKFKNQWKSFKLKNTNNTLNNLNKKENKNKLTNDVEMNDLEGQLNHHNDDNNSERFSVEFEQRPSLELEERALVDKNVDNDKKKVKMITFGFVLITMVFFIVMNNQYLTSKTNNNLNSIVNNNHPTSRKLLQTTTITTEFTTKFTKEFTKEFTIPTTIFGVYLRDDEIEYIKSKHNNYDFPPNQPISIIGYLIGCICALFYMGARLPQIYKNFKRKSTEGLSPLLFMCAFSGNILYASSLFLYDPTSILYLLSRAPWITESSVNSCLDSVILMQIIYYNLIRKKSYIDLKKEEGKKKKRIKSIWNNVWNNVWKKKKKKENKMIWMKQRNKIILLKICLER
ncbi:hypothetical protein ABK040_003996 [Willaertia magna]